jgi:Domain of unknown function (DUF6431)
MSKVHEYQNRTAIVYFGSTKQDYLKLVEADSHREFLDYIKPQLQVQLTAAHHAVDCPNSERYTVHSQRSRQLQGWLGEAETIPVCRVRCCGCRAVFTVLPSFIMRYRRQDVDCLGKLMVMNLGMGLTLRETATIYQWLGTERLWQPSWVWGLVQWLGNLLPVAFLLMRLGLTPPPIYSVMRSLPS